MTASSPEAIASKTGGTYKYKAPKKTKDLKGHEALLRGLEASGATITLQFRDQDDQFSGIVKHSDPYTISVEDEDGEVFVFFKHALIGFQLPKRVEAES